MKDKERLFWVPSDSRTRDSTVLESKSLLILLVDNWLACYYCDSLLSRSSSFALFNLLVCTQSVDAIGKERQVLCLWHSKFRLVKFASLYVNFFFPRVKWSRVNHPAWDSVSQNTMFTCWRLARFFQAKPSTRTQLSGLQFTRPCPSSKARDSSGPLKWPLLECPEAESAKTRMTVVCVPEPRILIQPRF